MTVYHPENSRQQEPEAMGTSHPQSRAGSDGSMPLCLCSTPSPLPMQPMKQFRKSQGGSPTSSSPITKIPHRHNHRPIQSRQLLMKPLPWVILDCFRLTIKITIAVNCPSSQQEWAEFSPNSNSWLHMASAAPILDQQHHARIVVLSRKGGGLHPLQSTPGAEEWSV